MDIFGENTFPKRETSSLSLRRKTFGLSRKDRSNRKSCTVVVEREDTWCWAGRGGHMLPGKRRDSRWCTKKKRTKGFQIGRWGRPSDARHEETCQTIVDKKSGEVKYARQGEHRGHVMLDRQRKNTDDVEPGELQNNHRYIWKRRETFWLSSENHKISIFCTFITVNTGNTKIKTFMSQLWPPSFSRNFKKYHSKSIKH